MFNRAPVPDRINGLLCLSLGGPLEEVDGDFEGVAVVSLFLTPEESVLAVAVLGNAMECYGRCF